MGVFDLFGRERKPKIERGQTMGYSQSTSQTTQQQGPVAVFSPTSYDDVETIINALKAGKQAVVHLTQLKEETAIRVLDMLSGAVFALGGGVYEMSKNVFMFSSLGVEIG
jgi:cell division inhibitor SepF